MKIKESQLRQIIRESLMELMDIQPSEKQQQINQDWNDMRNDSDVLKHQFNKHQKHDDNIRDMYVNSHPEKKAALNAMKDLNNPYYADDDSFANGEEWRY